MTPFQTEFSENLTKKHSVTGEHPVTGVLILLSVYDSIATWIAMPRHHRLNNYTPLQTSIVCLYGAQVT